MVNPHPGLSALPFSGHWIGERGWCLETGDTTLSRYVQLQTGEFPELDDVIPSDGSLLLVFKRGAVASDALRAALVEPLSTAGPVEQATHTLRVRYGGEAGPDLERLAAQAGWDVATCIERLCAATYRVAFLGFQPGFPYLRGLPAELHAARRATPRVRVPAGSVAIGGAYAGIYPASGPGGWQIIGQTGATIFDPERAEPALMLPGDRVRFVADD
ncbi:MAG: 5-oxoprolinase subunit PxpB [Thiobacillus sp.]|nr:5-oxoprolinase subunit PxpB [Thiobacillus sp.]